MGVPDGLVAFLIDATLDPATEGPFDQKAELLLRQSLHEMDWSLSGRSPTPVRLSARECGSGVRVCACI